MTQQNTPKLSSAELEALKRRYEALSKELYQVEYALHLAKNK